MKRLLLILLTLCLLPCFAFQLASQTPVEASLPTYFYDSYASYDELTKAFAMGNSYSRVQLSKDSHGELHKKTVEYFVRGSSIYAPMLNGQLMELRESDDSFPISYFSEEMYNLPFLWYHASKNLDADLNGVLLSCLTALEDDTLLSTTDAMELVRRIYKKQYPHTAFPSNRYTPVTLQLADRTVSAVRYLYNTTAYRYEFAYDGWFVSVFAYDTVPDAFWRTFSLGELTSTTPLDSLHVAEHELHGLELEEGETVIKLYSEPFITNRLHSGTHLKWLREEPWFVIASDTGIQKLSFRENKFGELMPVKSDLPTYYSERFRILAEHAQNPMPLFEGVEKDADFTILEVYCFYQASPSLAGKPLGGILYFVTSQGDYVYYNPLESDTASVAESNGYLFPYEVLNKIANAHVYDYRKFHQNEEGGRYRYDAVYDLSQYLIHGNEGITLHVHTLYDSVHIPEEELEGLEIGDSDTLIRIYTPSAELPQQLSTTNFDLIRLTSPTYLLLLDNEGVWLPTVIPDHGFFKDPYPQSFEAIYRTLVAHAYDPHNILAAAGLEGVTVLETHCFFDPEGLNVYNYASYIYYVTDQGDYVYYAPNRTEGGNGYLIPASLVKELPDHMAADYEHHEVHPGFRLYYDDVYDLTPYRVHGNETVVAHKHDTSELNPKEEPQTKDFPYALVIGASLAVIAVGTVSIVWVRKKRREI